MKDFLAGLFGGSPKSATRAIRDESPRGGTRPRSAAPGPPANTTFKKGDIIGNEYFIHRLLGRGGFGEVYLAYTQDVGTACALKTIRTDLLPDAASREAFTREALLWVNLEEHPFILTARVVREFSRRLFVDMDYIGADAKGRVSLADYLTSARGPLDEGDSIKWGIQFCYGMEHSLRHGVKCHRDIKPANVLIASDGTLKITDFGLALAAQAALTNQRGSVVTVRGDGTFGFSLAEVDGNRICGTPGYIAPEVLLGREANVRSDIYSLGLILWQIAKGSPVPPFHVPYEKVANVEEYLRRVLELQLKGHVPGVGGQMRSAIEHCLAPEPSQRYASFGDLRKELEMIYRRQTGRAIVPPKASERTAGFWKNKGVSLDELGKHEQSIACYDKALEIDARDAYTWSNKGTAFSALGRYAEAIICFDKALRIDPQNALAWCNKGITLKAQRQYEEALTCFARSLEADPQNAIVWDNKGWALLSLARYEEALACFDKSVRIDPHYASARTGRAFALFSLGRLKEGEESLEEARAIDPQCEDDWKQTLATLGNHGMALRSSKAEAVAWNKKGTALAEAGRHDAGLACFAKALEVDPQFGAAWYNKGGACFFLGRHEEAVACYIQTLRIDPLYAEAWDRKGLSLAMLGQYEEAIASWTKCLELSPVNVSAWANRGKALDALGRTDEAIICFNKALEIEPDCAVVWDNKGTSLLSVYRYEEAIACFTRALEIDPHFSAALENRRRALEIARSAPDLTDDDIPF